MRTGSLAGIAAGIALAALFTGSLRAERPASQAARDNITRQVRHELRMLPYYGVFDDLKFRVDGRQVTLLGEVTRPALKSDAERVIRTIEGVEGVTNEIDVLPASPSDDGIREAVYRAIYGHSALSRYALGPNPPIHIIVRQGHVTLEGVVASRSDKHIAGIQANTVPGIFSVANHLTVEKS